MDEWVWLAYALGGTLLASLLACIPALHVYNVAALLLLFHSRLQASGADLLPPQGLAMFLLGMVVGYAVCNTIPSLFLSSPDASTAWIVPPGQRYLMRGRGHEAAVLCGVGSLGGAFALLILAPFAASILAPLRTLLQPHLHWLLALVVLYLLLSEWPKGEGRGETALARLWDGWRSLLGGLAAFALSGVLGLILAYRPLVRPGLAFLGLTPAFVGLFAVPWLLQSLLARTQIPRQVTRPRIDVTPVTIATGVGTGVLGGLVGAFFPFLTGGIGGLIAGHATAQRDDRSFLISQGSSKTIYLVGALLFLFAPGLHLRRGGMASMVSAFYRPLTPQEYWRAVAAATVCSAVAFLALLGLSRLAADLVGRLDARWLSAGTLLVLVVVLLTLTGWQGLLVASVATGVGLIPLLSGARRLNVLGLILVPALLNMAGLGSVVAGWLGLL